MKYVVPLLLIAMVFMSFDEDKHCGNVKRGLLEYYAHHNVLLRIDSLVVSDLGTTTAKDALRPNVDWLKKEITKYEQMFIDYDTSFAKVKRDRELKLAKGLSAGYEDTMLQQLFPKVLSRWKLEQQMYRASLDSVQALYANADTVKTAGYRARFTAWYNGSYGQKSFVGTLDMDTNYHVRDGFYRFNEWGRVQW